MLPILWGFVPIHKKVSEIISVLSGARILSILGTWGIILFFLSVWQIKWVSVDVDDFLGLTAHLPLTYWLGLGIITLCSLVLFLGTERRSSWMYVFILLILGLYLFGIGVFAEENARAWSSYYPTAEAKNILEDHRINLPSDLPLISYLNWPAFHLINVILISVTDIDLTVLLEYMPLFWVVFFVIVTFALGQSLHATKNSAFLVSFLAIAMFWQIYSYYSPQSYAYLISLLLILIITGLKEVPQKYIAIFLSLSMLLISHFFYAVIFFFSVGVQMIRRHRFVVVIFIGGIFLIWYTYLSPVVFQTAVSKFISSSVHVDASLSTQFNKFTPKTEYKQIVDCFRFAYAGILGFFGAISLWRYQFKPLPDDVKRKVRDLLFWMLPALIFVAMDYGKEGFERVFLFCIVPMVGIISLAISDRKIITFLMVLVVILHIPAHYGSDAFFQTHTQDLKGADFFASSLDGLEHEDIRYTFLPGGDRFVNYYDTDFVCADFSSRHLLEILRNKPITHVFDYYIEGVQTKNYLQYYGAENPLHWYGYSEDYQYDLSQIYENGGTRIFQS
ncbi:MAG: hypothetical protein PHQ81_05140 [Methanofollis sp.]|nr:hypothetical protein [Methanofollis sp.]